MSNESQTCEVCGARLPAHAPGGPCPACLVRSAIGQPDELGSSARAIPAEGEPTTRVTTPIEQGLGTMIGRYKLLEKIGEGGFGTVYVAEQREPVKRRVALKIIKLGMDTKQVIARFEAERQALAMMDHPNIAKVLEAGATDTGRPYFVMELVRGIRITDYCDQNNLSIRQRLDLFIEVCQAIQHAHQKGIIHRDIKPSNILVTLHDGMPVPKVIDFGIAKATQGELTDKTVYTQLQEFIGTPAYMSPEQAEMSGLDIDTRADIYSLGVLLYELLTGKTPFDAEDLLEAGLEQMRRTIRTREPLRPSTRLTQELASKVESRKQKVEMGGGEISADLRRRLQTMIELLRGDLDWIVMKCLEKDRTRRYDTANGVAMDVQRYLNTEPVTARPPSQLYRLRKMVRRNKLAFGAVSAVAAALVIGLGLSTWLFVQERQTRQRAETAEREQNSQRQQAEAEGKKARDEAAKSQQVAKFLQDMLQSVGPSVAQGRDTAMLQEILDKTAERISNDLTNQPEVEAELRTTIGSVYEELGQLWKAEEPWRKALALRRKLPGAELGLATSLRNLGSLLLQMGKPSEGRAMIEEALAINRRLLGNENIEVAKCMSDLIGVVYNTDTLAETEELVRQVLGMQIKLLGREHKDVAESLAWLALLQAEKGELAKGEDTMREALAMDRKVLGESHPDIPGALSSLSWILRQRGKLLDAEAASREALTKFEKLMGRNELDLPTGTLDELTDILRAEGKFAEAGALAHERFAKREADLNVRLASQPGEVHFLFRRGNLRGRMGRWREAAADLSKAVELGSDYHHNFVDLAAVLVESGDLEAYRRVCAQIRKQFGGTDSEEIATMMTRAGLIVPSPDSADLVTDRSSRIGTNSPWRPADTWHNLQTTNHLADGGARFHKGDLFLLSSQSCKALAEYRQGRFASAAESASKALSQPEYCCDSDGSKISHGRRVEASMVLAMSKYQLHQSGEARTVLAKGLEIADAKLAKLESGDLGLFWADWVFADMLIREAKVLIEGGSKTGEETKTSDSSAVRKDPP